MKRGFTLIELMIATVFVAAFIGIVTMMSITLLDTHHKVTRALTDVEIAGRLMDHVREDVRNALTAEIVEPGRLRLSLREGTMEYRFDSETGTVHSQGHRGRGLYALAFAEVRFHRPRKNVIAVEVELARQHPEATYRARIYRAIHGRNLK